MFLKLARLMSMTIALTFLLSACGESASAIAKKYDGKVVHQPTANRGREDGLFIVKDGKRNWITDAGWLAKNNYDPGAIIEISSDEFNAIPEDPKTVN